MFLGVSVLEVLPCEQRNKSIKAVYSHTSKGLTTILIMEFCQESGGTPLPLGSEDGHTGDHLLYRPVKKAQLFMAVLVVWGDYNLLQHPVYWRHASSYFVRTIQQHQSSVLQKNMCTVFGLILTWTNIKNRELTIRFHMLNNELYYTILTAHPFKAIICDCVGCLNDCYMLFCPSPDILFEPFQRSSSLKITSKCNEEKELFSHDQYGTSSKDATNQSVSETQFICDPENCNEWE